MNKKMFFLIGIIFVLLINSGFGAGPSDPIECDAWVTSKLLFLDGTYFSDLIEQDSTVIASSTFSGKTFYSENYGKTWAESSTHPGAHGMSEIYGMEIAPSTKLLAVGNNDNVATSGNRGVVWGTLGAVLEVSEVNLITRMGNNVAIASGDTVYISPDNGISWVETSLVPIAGAPGVEITAMAYDGSQLWISAYKDARSYLYYNGNALSDDPVERMWKDSEVFGSARVDTLYADGLDIYAGMQLEGMEGRIEYSSNGGNDWTAATSIDSARQIKEILKDGDYYALVQIRDVAGDYSIQVHKSADGHTWENLYSITEPTGDVVTPNKLLIGSNGKMLVAVLDGAGSTTARIYYCNQAPVADAGADQIITLGETATIDASGSYDPDDLGGDSDIASEDGYSWKISNYATGELLEERTTDEPTLQYIPTSAIIYDVKLTVRDMWTTESEEDTMLIQVNAPQDISVSWDESCTWQEIARAYDGIAEGVSIQAMVDVGEDIYVAGRVYNGAIEADTIKILKRNGSEWEEKWSRTIENSIIDFVAAGEDGFLLATDYFYYFFDSDMGYLNARSPAIPASDSIGAITYHDGYYYIATNRADSVRISRCDMSGGACEVTTDAAGLENVGCLKEIEFEGGPMLFGCNTNDARGSTFIVEPITNITTGSGLPSATLQADDELVSVELFDGDFHLLTRKGVVYRKLAGISYDVLGRLPVGDPGHPIELKQIQGKLYAIYSTIGLGDSGDVFEFDGSSWKRYMWTNEPTGRWTVADLVRVVGGDVVADDLYTTGHLYHADGQQSSLFRKSCGDCVVDDHCDGGEICAEGECIPEFIDMVGIGTQRWVSVGSMDETPTSITSNGNTLYVGGYSGASIDVADPVVLQSSDGVTWSALGTFDISPGFVWKVHVLGGDLFAIVAAEGAAKIFKLEGDTWVDKYTAPGGVLNDMTRFGGTLMAASYGGSNRVVTSTDDGETWENALLEGASALDDVGLFFFHAVGNTLYTGGRNLYQSNRGGCTDAPVCASALEAPTLGEEESILDMTGVDGDLYGITFDGDELDDPGKLRRYSSGSWRTIGKIPDLLVGGMLIRQKLKNIDGELFYIGAGEGETDRSIWKFEGGMLKEYPGLSGSVTDAIEFNGKTYALSATESGGLFVLGDCETDAHCDDDEECTDYECVAIGTLPGDDEDDDDDDTLPGAGDGDGDAGDGGAGPGNPPGAECDANSDCQANAFCNSDDECEVLECAEGYEAREHVCVLAAAEGDGDAGGDDDTLVTDGSPCTGDFQCASNAKCVNNVCQALECPEGFSARNHECKEIVGVEGRACASDEECGEGFICVEGSCTQNIDWFTLLLGIGAVLLVLALIIAGYFGYQWKKGKKEEEGFGFGAEEEELGINKGKAVEEEQIELEEAKPLEEEDLKEEKLPEIKTEEKEEPKGAEKIPELKTEEMGMGSKKAAFFEKIKKGNAEKPKSGGLFEKLKASKGAGITETKPKKGSLFEKIKKSGTQGKAEGSDGMAFDELGAEEKTKPKSVWKKKV